MKRIPYLISILAICFSSMGLSKDERKSLNRLINTIQSQGFVGIKGKMEKNHLYVDTKINGKKRRLIVDTGATNTFLGKNHAKRLKLKEKRSSSSQAIHGQTLTTISVAETFEIGGFKIKNWPITVLDKKSELPVLGMDFLTTFNAVILCRYGVIFINPDTPIDWAQSINDWGFLEADVHCYEFNSDGIKTKRFLVELEVDGVSGDVVVDTGAFMSIIDNLFFQQSSAIIESITGAEVSDIAGKSKGVRQIDGYSIKVGNVELPEKGEFQATPDVRRTPTYHSREVFGFLGSDLLSVNKAIIDVGNGQMFFDIGDY